MLKSFEFLGSADYDGKIWLQEILFPQGILCDNKIPGYRTTSVKRDIELTRLLSNNSSDEKRRTIKKISGFILPSTMEVPIIEPFPARFGQIQQIKFVSRTRLSSKTFIWMIVSKGYVGTNISVRLKTNCCNKTKQIRSIFNFIGERQIDTTYFSNRACEKGEQVM